MKGSRISMIIWFALIFVLLIVEVAEITHVFTVPVQNVIGDPLTLVIALVFTTIVALVGAVFIGLYLSHRILSPTGFTPFEEEMLRMRADVQQVKRDVAELRARSGTDPPDSRSSPERPEEP
ncbi:MAG TPA: hypothetical protein VEG66_07420 [Thermoplasmata archaeon]|nr:hypothetical protein [Thermoplasmata archaeon]